MATVTKFEDLDAWKTARELTNRVYDMSDKGPFARDFALRDQIRRAAISVLSNIAEGFDSPTQATFINFLGHAKGSSGEVRAQSYIALDRSYITQPEFEQLRELTDKASRQIARLVQYLESQPKARRVRDDTIEYTLTR